MFKNIELFWYKTRISTVHLHAKLMFILLHTWHIYFEPKCLCFWVLFSNKSQNAAIQDITTDRSKAAFLLKFSLIRLNIFVLNKKNLCIRRPGFVDKKFMLKSAEHEFFLLINVTIVGILIFMSRKNSVLGLSQLEKPAFLDIFIVMSI